MMHRTTRRARSGALLLAAAAFVAACGDSDDADPAATTAVETTAAPMDDMEMDGEEHMDDMDVDDMDMDDMAMNMGDVNATPAEEVAGAELASGEFVLLDTRPSGFDGVTGSATIARHDGGTTVTVRLAGLPAGEQLISHVHEAPCAENGGDHFKFDPEGSDLPPNEIHLRFDAAEDGTGFMTAENDMVAGDDAVSFVVHPVDLIDNKIACVDFAPVEAEAASGGEGASGEAVEAVEVVALEVVGGEVADVPGIFEIELEGSGTLLAQLEVS